MKYKKGLWNPLGCHFSKADSEAMSCIGVSTLMELDLWQWWEEQLLRIPREGNSFRILSHICMINIHLPFGSILCSYGAKEKKEKENCIRMAKQIHILALHEVQLWCGFTSKAISFACMCVTSATKFDNNELIGSQRS